MKGGEKWDVTTGKESAKESKTKVIETKEEHEVEVELNSILKKGPSKYSDSTYTLIRWSALAPGRVQTL